MQDNKSIIEMAVALGKAIAESDVMKEFNDAREAYLRDPKLGTLIKEYSVQKIALENQMKDEKANPEFTDVINKRIDEIYAEIEKSDTMSKYGEAEGNLNDFMNDINTAISSQFATEDEGCSSEDCSHCSGCGHSH